MGRRRRDDDGGLIDELVAWVGEIARSGPVGMGVVAAFLLVSATFLSRASHAKDAGLAGQFADISSSFCLLFGVPLAIGAAIWGLLRSGKRRGDRSSRAAPSSATRARRNLATSFADQRPPGNVPRDGRAFETRIAALFRKLGFIVEETGTHGRGGDGGIDLILRRPADDGPPDAPHRLDRPVQCKDYADYRVGVERVRAFYGAAVARGPFAEAIVVTTSRFTAEARAFAAPLPMRLIDGDELENLLREAGPIGDDDVGQVQSPRATGAPATAPPDVPLCPRCRAPMRRREPRREVDDWHAFWGCSHYPNCRGKVEIAANGGRS